MLTNGIRRWLYILTVLIFFVFGALFWWLPSWRPVLMMATLGLVAIGLVTYQSMRAYILFKNDAIQMKNQQRPCPFCEAPIYKSDKTCPYCRRDVPRDTQ